MDLLIDRLNENASRFGQKTAVTFVSSGKNGGNVENALTYKELKEATNALAKYLKANGIKPGDRVVLVYPPSLDFMVAFLACLVGGIVAVPVFPPTNTRKDTMLSFSRIVEGCDAKHALTSSSYNHMKKIAGIKDTFQRLKRSNTSWPERLNWIVTTDAKASKSESIEDVAHKNAAPDVAFLQYTSGSTSDPKGVMITHGNLAHNLTIITNELKATDDTVVVSWLPQYHDMGLIGSYLGVLYCGGSGYYMSPLTFLQRPMLWLEAVSKYHATHLQAPNFAFKLVSRKFRARDYDESGFKLDFASVRHIINGAEPVDEDSMKSFYNAFGPFGLQRVIYPTYGLAEHTVFVCSGGTQCISVSKQRLELDGQVVLVENVSSMDTSRLVGCGYPFRQGVDVVIVNTESLTEVDERVVGEIWINSPSKAAGYFGKVSETKEDFQAKLGQSNESSNDESSNPGYLRTGDLGFLHNRELFICGRLKDLIIVGGRNYYPQDIEATAEAASDLVRPGCSAAFTIDPTTEGDEEVAIVMELREVPKSNDVEAVCLPIVTAVRAAVLEEHSLGVSKISLLRTRTVPKTSSGKIARAWCRQRFVSDSLDTVYRKTFKDSLEPLEIESSPGTGAAQTTRTKRLDPEEIRSMDKKTLLSKLVAEVAKLSSTTHDAVKTDVPLVTILDSLSISQFTGQLEVEYATKLSDEYLFRESTTILKLVDVVKLGYAPDDEDGNSQGAHAPVGSQGTAGGLAGALGCPPGVVCCVIL